VQPDGGHERDLPSDHGHEGVESAELGADLSDEPVDIGPRPDIADQRNGTCASFGQLLRSVTRLPPPPITRVFIPSSG
jgi:hypothetical protein